MQLLKLNTIKTKSKNKYRAKKTKLDGMTFDSKKEANRYAELKTLQFRREITDLQCHVKYYFTHNEMNICTYIADFTYTDLETDLFVVEDVKGWNKKKKEFITTPLYRLKRKMMKVFYNIDVKEV